MQHHASWLKSQCNELEVLERVGKSDLIYAKVKELCKDEHEEVKKQ